MVSGAVLLGILQPHFQKSFPGNEFHLLFWGSIVATIVMGIMIAKNEGLSGLKPQTAFVVYGSAIAFIGLATSFFMYRAFSLSNTNPALVYVVQDISTPLIYLVTIVLSKSSLKMFGGADYQFNSGVFAGIGLIALGVFVVKKFTEV